ncbi:synaptojanin-2-binding protein [Takifugu rubripes]|uniref:Synaptojanin-2-binding protein n=1 Tax=Takifugu rubripes TaxID=31033 RepID=A0A3B5KB48_TAKRU|nr:synaptojanin-2-binding protein [Takifugu rubripes]|eukprot:XP_003962413.1 PREDICTED: synaptojanin-2-binding protein [Takifugu rubripes]
MNDSATTVETIKLKRGPTGLGFNIVGGVDQHYVANDASIYVSKIKEDGAAALDGRLQEGDKILSINGIWLKDREHRHVVDLFKTAGEDVELCVQKKVPNISTEPTNSEPEPKSSVSSLQILTVLGAAAAVLAFIYLRRSRKDF